MIDDNNTDKLSVACSQVSAFTIISNHTVEGSAQSSKLRQPFQTLSDLHGVQCGLTERTIFDSDLSTKINLNLPNMIAAGISCLH